MNSTRPWRTDNLAVALLLAIMGVFLIAPLTVLALQSLTGPDGAASLANYAHYIAEPGLRRSFANTLGLAFGVAAIVTPLAFTVAYALERSRIPLKGALTAVTAVPLLMPSLLPALALVYLFGHQGLLTPLFGGRTIYGAQGVLVADVIATFPHALIILRTALAAADGRLYEQAKLLGASSWRTFWTVTVPGAGHGLMSAVVVVASLTIADVGAPKVVGGDFDVLALDIYKQILGRQDFAMGSVAAMMLLAGASLAMVFERMAAQRQAAQVSSRSTGYAPPKGLARDLGLGLVCALIAAAILGVLVVCQLAALVKLWPYELSLSLTHYHLDQFDGGGWSAVLDTAALGLATVVVGTATAFLGAYASERTGAWPPLRRAVSAFALAPAAVPGLALGLAYILFFNAPANPLLALYGTVAMLVAVTVTHFYTVAHLTCVSALKALDMEFESAGETLGRSRWTVAWRVLAPMCAPALIEVAVYLFVGATTTVSAVVFLYPADFKLASVAVLNMDDAGDVAPAAAMGMFIVYLNVLARGAGLWARRMVEHRLGGFDR
jgi:iron(III) transport system permease protein